MIFIANFYHALQFFLQIGGFYIWTHTYNLIKNDRVILDRNTNSGEEDVMEEGSRSKRLANADSDTDFKGTTLLLTGGSEATTNVTKFNQTRL